MKRSLYFWSLLPIVYAVTGMILDALLFNQWTLDTSLFQILHLSLIGPIFDLFQCIVLVVAIAIAYLLASNPKVQAWNLLHRTLPALPFVGILIGIALTFAFWFLALPVAILSACLCWWNMSALKRRRRTA